MCGCVCVCVGGGGGGEVIFPEVDGLILAINVSGLHFYICWKYCQYFISSISLIFKC